MDIIEPNKSPEQPSDTPKPEEKVYAFRIDMNTPGVMKLEVNLEMISQSRDAMWKFIGFMEDHKNMGLQLVTQMVAQREALKSKIATIDSTHKTQNFLNKILRR